MKGLALLVVVLFAACRSAAPSPYGFSGETRVSRESERALELNRRAAELLATDVSAAERLLREALSLDLYCGPAHNNLGIAHLVQGRLYEAAHEFEWARKLLPGHPDPRLNLAITLQQAGRTADSEEAFEAALEAHPGYLPALQGLARLHLEHGIEDERVPGWLRRIVIEGESESWRKWAERQLAMPRSASR